MFYCEILVFQSVVKCMSWNNKEEIETTCTVQQ